MRCALSDSLGVPPIPKGFRRRATRAVIRHRHHPSLVGYLLRDLVQKIGAREGYYSKVVEIARLNDVPEWSGMGAPFDHEGANGYRD